MGNLSEVQGISNGLSKVVRNLLSRPPLFSSANRCEHVAPHIVERGYGEAQCNLLANHEGMHRSDGDRWEIVGAEEEDETTP